MSEIKIDATPELAKLGRGELDPGASLPVVRAALAGDSKNAQRLYTAFRDLVWHTLFSRQSGEELSRWHDVLAYSVSLSKQRKLMEASLQLKVLAELVAQSVRYALLQPDKTLLERRHVPDLLRELASNASPTPRKHLSEALEIADANLSRVLNLAIAGLLVQRHKDGKAAAFSLTDAGRRAAGDLGSGVTSAARIGIGGLPFAVAVWDKNGGNLANNEQFETVSKALGIVQARTSKANWQAAFESASRHLAVQRENTFEVQLPRGEYVYGAMTRDGETDVCVMLDVSAYHKRSAGLEARLVDLEAELTSLRAKLAESDHRSIMRRNLAARAYQDIAEAAARANYQAITVHNTPGTGVDELVNSINGVSHRANLLRNFYAPAEWAVQSPINVKETLENTVRDFQDTWGGMVTLKVERSAAKAPASSLVFTLVNRVFLALLVNSRGAVGSLNLRAVADRESVRCHFVFDRMVDPARYHSGAFDHLDAVLGDLATDVRWDVGANAGKGFVVTMPVIHKESR